VPRLDPERLLEDLDPEQREAVLATSGPVAILAGAGTGKTRVISRRTAYAIATEVVPPDQALVVTFTDKAAGEMVERLRSLGLPGVTARTFHAHALSQLRHFWPSRHDGAPIPQLLDSKIPILGRLARQLPGHFRFTPAKDLADEIEWAKSRRIEPRAYEREVARVDPGREPPIPLDLFVRTFDNYERAKTRQGRIDFDDLLVETIRLLEDDAEAADTVRARKRWFSVDEYQDTSPLQQRLLELWLGDRPDLCVVGDVDQTIYTFTGATSDFLTTFGERHPGTRVLDLTRNYRSTPQVLELANRLIAADGRSKRLSTSREAGPEPTVRHSASADEELDALVAGIRVLIRDGVTPAEVAVLVRMNAQIEPLEEALTRAGIAYQVRGVRFYDRPEVKSAVASLRATGLRATGLDATGLALVAAIRHRWVEDVGFEEDGAAASEGREAQERQSSLETLLAIVTSVAHADLSSDAAAVVTELDRRAAHERAGAVDGVNLLTYHRAKGLEWDAVFLPMLEEGSLPIRQALDDDAALAEERRLLYVGITRARVHLALSWAERRETRGREGRRQPSRFLLDMRLRSTAPAGQRRVRDLGGPPAQPRPPRPGDNGDPVFVALREWRLSTAREEGTAAFIVAHDSLLTAIAEARPASLAALRRVKGMGPTKLEKYGDGILEVLAAID
jgi:DNA helicase II / ATP-dependent DNA helicase PcrA